MTENKERWMLRLESYGKALARLDEVLHLQAERPLTPLELDGMIQRFEYTQEMAWKLLKNYIEYQNNISLAGSRDTVRHAFANHLIDNPEPWIDMLDSRNLTSHIYDGEVELKVVDKIQHTFYPVLKELNTRFLGILKG
ncbi:MAG: nucleotidyltransferase substrate binding protein [Prevotella sp.]|nr:nucleotidyltransferase substrate binding protein [Prevotella sp.]